MSDIGLPNGMTRDDAYVQGMADGINEVMRKLEVIYNDHETCSNPYDRTCDVIEDILEVMKNYE